MAIKSFQQYREEMENPNLPDTKKRNGLADPDPGELKNPHKASPQDLDLAKQAIQLAMTRNARYHLKVYNFLKKLGYNFPEVANLVDQMKKPKGFDKLTAPELGKNDKTPDVLQPSSADTSPAYYQQ